MRVKCARCDEPLLVCPGGVAICSHCDRACACTPIYLLDDGSLYDNKTGLTIDRWGLMPDVVPTRPDQA